MTSENTSKRHFLTIEQVTEELNVGLPTVRALLTSGELRGIQIGGRGLWRIGAQDLEDYIEQAYLDAGKVISTAPMEAAQ